MSWLRIDDGFVEHERIDPLSDRAFRLHVAALCHCARNLTDGVITEKNVKVLRVRANNATTKHVQELVQAGVWVTFESGYRINDYLDYNPSSAKVKQQREKQAARVAEWRSRNGVGNGVTDDVTNGARNGTPSHPIPKTINSNPSFLPRLPEHGKEGTPFAPELLKEVDAA